jgi:Tfp pilus assembly protein PilF
MSHEHGDPHAGVGSASGCISGADGGRLRSGRRALSVLAGAPSHGRLEDAIAECKRAIEIDPEFGNPYNDIGAYLIEQSRFDEAIPWLERATEAQRYEPRHFPHYNLGRAYLGKEMYANAMRCFQEALNIEPRYSLARQALASLRRMVN